MKHIIYSLIVISFISCSKERKVVKKEAISLKNSISNYAKHKGKDTFDNIFPIFNSEVPDTKYNKKRFKEFIKVPLTEDVKNIYCFNDDIGIDVDYMFSFNCNQETADKIIEVHQLKLTTQNDRAFGLQTDDFDWWNKTRIKQLPFYKNDAEPNIYFWFDEKNNKAYFFEFTL